MSVDDTSTAVRAHGWRTLAALHGLIETKLERALREVDLSMVEFTVLDALRRQDGFHMRMQQLARAAALSPSAITRLVNRLEERALLTRVLCADDRRGLYTELTHSGQALLDRATPIHAAALEGALAEARDVPELEELAVAVDRLEGASV